MSAIHHRIADELRAGDVIRERQYNGQERRVESVCPYHWIMARGIVSGRVTTIAWRNLHRYEIVKPGAAA